MEHHYAIMFADVAGSTNMYDTLGDVEAERQINWCLQEMTNITRAHGGHVIKTIGDEIMASFDSADEAAEAAIDMQMNISGDENNKLIIRIGMQYGQAIERDGDLFGDAVNVAARMAGIAKGLQIITTEDLVRQLNPELNTRARLFDLATVKGKDEELRIHQVLWEEEAKVTRFATSHELRKIAASTQAVVLKLGDEERLFTSEDLEPAIPVGKDPACTVCVDARYASRSHADLGYRRGKFVISDHSTNGTYVQFKGQEELFLRREELTLMGEGIISLGESVETGAPNLISFNILQAGNSAG